MSNEASIRAHGGADREPAADGRRDAAVGLVDEADRLIAEALPPGRWPEDQVAEAFVVSGRLERALALYAQAMRLDPDEPAYPWNLASALGRLGLSDLALGFISRAIAAAERVGDRELSGSAAHLALAETALDADRPDQAVLAVARAKQLGAGSEELDHGARLVAEAAEQRGDLPTQIGLAAALVGRAREG
jgi:tetratricopeptide (TPR) repeat protein